MSVIELDRREVPGSARATMMLQRAHWAAEVFARFDHERVVRTFAEGPGELDLVMIYEVRAGRIRRAWNIVGAKTVHAPA